MTIPKIKLAAVPETEEAKRIYGINGMKLPQLGISLEECQMAFPKISILFVINVNRQ